MEILIDLFVDLVKYLCPKVVDKYRNREKEEYLRGITSPEYIKWERDTLQEIYKDMPFVKVFKNCYPAYIIPGSDSIQAPFDDLMKNSVLGALDQEPVRIEKTRIYRKFNRIVGANIRRPKLIGYTSNGFKFDSDGKICGIKVIPRTYEKTAYSCHILHLELWDAYRRLRGKRLAKLADLPLRNKIHEGSTDSESVKDIVLDGRNRSALNDVAMAVIDYDSNEKNYKIAYGIRSRDVATYPGYFSFVPSGGFEMFELEENQHEDDIEKNFSVFKALCREYFEEMYGGGEFNAATGNDDYNRLLSRIVVPLEEGISKRTHTFVFLGVTFDLVTLRQTLCFALKIDDEDTPLAEHGVQKNNEHRQVTFIPVKDIESHIEKCKEPVMPESAGLFALLKNTSLYKNAFNNEH